MQLSLPTGKVISLSVYQWLFMLKEEDVDEFYQTCVADDLGIEIDNPFSNKIVHGRLEVEDTLPEIADEAEED